MLKTTLNVSKITINDKVRFDYFFNIAKLSVSELSFTNLFMWRDYYDIQYCILDDFLCIISKGQEDKPFCFFPIGDYNNRSQLICVIYQLRDYFKDMGKELVFSRVESSQISVLNELGIAFKTIEDRANFDYIYSVQSLSSLKGKKLDGKRNHINKFKKLYTFEYKTISEENISDCKNIIDKWCLQKSHSTDSSLIHEKNANLEVLNNYYKLDLKGALIIVNGIPEAFTIGEKLNNDTVVIHVEKGNSEIHGLYPLINQQFLANEWSDSLYVNREQDLGIEGLRKAKLSYNPIGYVEKYIVELV